MDATKNLEDLKSGIISPNELVQNAISKIESTHKSLNAAVEIMKTEAERQLKDLPDGPLKGLPVSVKECYAIEGKTIRSGSLRMPPIECGEDATVVKKLRQAGAVIVARGNTSEFLLGRETNNRIYGTTNNPINQALTVGGSSGGDGAMVAEGCVNFAIGTDIGGSCRYPAVFCGITGFKPASGQIDKTGIFPEAGNDFTESMNSPGILCRSVRDARLVYNVIGNKALQVEVPDGKFKLYTSSGFRMKIEDDSIAGALHESIAVLKANAAGAEDLPIPESGALMNDFNALMFAGFRSKIYDWSVTSEGKKLSYFSELLARALKKPTLSDELFALLVPFNLLKPSAKKLEKIVPHVKATREKYYSIFGNNGILILPTVGITAPEHKKFIPQYNKPGVIEIITPVSFCNVLNLSCITIPAWKFQRNKSVNPPGIQLIAAPGNEELLLNVAEKLEGHLLAM